LITVKSQLAERIWVLDLLIRSVLGVSAAIVPSRIKLLESELGVIVEVEFC
jgi:hypothetical protein